eukprot:GHVS01037212.1.p1 GENE.GHVS01037212.1~~GHVS01037212.1.p1  ORF type:complete len:323 (-),score=81.23 GHVS01037212.1:220-1188(-)
MSASTVRTNKLSGAAEWTLYLTSGAYVRMMAHAFKHPTRTVNGVVLGKVMNDEKPLVEGEERKRGAKGANNNNTEGTPEGGVVVVVAEQVFCLCHGYILAPAMKLGFAMAEDYAAANGLQIIGYYHFEANLPPRPMPSSATDTTTTTTTTTATTTTATTTTATSVPNMVSSSTAEPSPTCSSSSSSKSSGPQFLSNQCLVVAEKLHAVCGEHAIVFTLEPSGLMGSSAHCIQALRRGTGPSNCWTSLVDVAVPRNGMGMTNKLLSTGGYLKTADLDDHLCNTDCDPLNASLLQEYNESDDAEGKELQQMWASLRSAGERPKA